MATINEVICKVLQLECNPAALNYYAVLGLPEGTSDKQAIASALQSAVSKLKAASATEPSASIDATKKVLQQCNSVLMTPEKKAAYDEQLKRAKRQPATVAKNPIAATDDRPMAKATIAEPALNKPDLNAPIIPEQIDPLADFLPAGDPHEDFSVRAFLDAAPVLPVQETVESRYVELEALRSGVPLPSNPSSKRSVSSFDQDNSASSNRSATNIQQRIRRKRAIRNSLTIGGLAVVSIILIATAVYQYMQSQQRRIAANRDQSNSLTPVVSADSVQPEDQAEATKPERSQNSKATTPTTSPFELPTVKEQFAEGTNSFFSDNEETKNSDASPMPATESSEAIETVTMMEKEFDQAEWDRLILATREAIAEKDFDRFNDLATELLAIQTDNRDLIRLRQSVDITGQLYRFGSEAFDAAIASLRSGFTVDTADDTVSFVERRENEVIFRVKGVNTTYKKEAIPPKILLAILNQGLDTSEAVDVASRGVFLKLYNAGEAYQAEGQKLLEQAAQLDSKFANIDDLSNPAYK